MTKWQGVHYPDQMDPLWCKSASQSNPVDADKVDKYVHMNTYSDPPPIRVMPTKISEYDIGLEFVNGIEIDQSHIGRIAYDVYEGHHRVCAAMQSGIYLLWQIAREGCVTQSQLEEWGQLYDAYAVVS